MAKYQKYAEYKDSGIEWLGEIPSHWTATALKRYSRITDGSHHSPKIEIEGFPFVSVTDVGINNINFFDAKKITETDYLRLVKEGCKPAVNDVLLTKDGTIGRACIVTEDMPDFVILSSLGLITPNKEISSHFLYYYLVSGINVDQMNSVIHGSALKRMTINKINDLILTFPDFYEQEKIASFLDHETAKIDSLIAKQEKLIELLKEKHQAVISHVVTKGLNPNVAMKDSGVEWLGQVPEHWTVTRAKFVSDIFVPQRNKPELNDMEGYSWVTMDDMKNKYIQSVNRYVTKNSAMLAGSKILKKGAVIASCVGNFGITSINNIDVIINQQLQAFIPRNIKAEYLQNLVSISKKYFELIGTAATLVYVNQEGFQNLPVLLPPYDEQVAICVQIENDENKYDQLIHLGLKQIKILQERRTALISSAVTGKIDVRNWQYPNEAKTELSA